jgi:hypothetical protein
MSAAERTRARSWFEHLCFLREMYRLRGEQDSMTSCSLREIEALVKQALATEPR